MPLLLARRGVLPSLAVSCLLFAALPVALHAQAFGGPGPHAVGYQELKLNNPLEGTAKLRLHVRYPALQAGTGTAPDLSGGPYPLIVFGHGYGSTPDPYVLLLEHVASWGFVVAATDTATWGPQELLAQDMLGAAAALDEAAVPGSTWAALLEPGAVGFAGHSMGGGAAIIAGALLAPAHLPGAVLALAPWNAPPSTAGVPSAAEAAALLGAPLSIIVGALDTITPVATDAAPLYTAASAVSSLRALSIVAGAGHNDPQLLGQAGNDGTAFLRAFLTGDASALDEVYGPSAQSDPETTLSFEAVDPDCFVTGVPSPGHVLGVHVSGPPGSELWCMAAAEQGLGAPPVPCLELPPDGLVVLSSGLAGASQLVSLDVLLPANLFGLSQFTWYLQGVAVLPDGSVGCSPVRTLSLLPAP